MNIKELNPACGLANTFAPMGLWSATCLRSQESVGAGQRPARMRPNRVINQMLRNTRPW